LPYVLPFVSPAARASIPAAAEVEFSAAAVDLSRDFYAELGRIVGRTMTLDATAPAFVSACDELLGLQPATPIADVLDAIADHDATIGSTARSALSRRWQVASAPPPADPRRSVQSFRRPS